jgi:hypothetical protein
MATLTISEIRIKRLKSEIAQLEARYDGLFPPAIFMVLKNLKCELAVLQEAS